MIGAKLCCMLTNALSFSYDLEARTMYALALTLKNAEISLDVPPTAHSIANALQTVLPTDVADGSLPDFNQQTKCCWACTRTVARTARTVG